MSKSLEFEIINAKANLKNLEALQEKGADCLSEIKDENIKNLFLNFFKDTNNELVLHAKGLNANLRTGALAFEAAYLGFGLPALNQRRLEKKYLLNEAQNQQTDFLNPSSALIEKNIKAHEIKLYHNFIK